MCDQIQTVRQDFEKTCGLTGQKESDCENESKFLIEVVELHKPGGICGELILHCIC